MRKYAIIFATTMLSGCKEEEPPISPPLANNIEISRPYEVVHVSLAGRDDLKVSVFERDGHLVATVIDKRKLSDNIEETIQRWEMIAKSNQEVAVNTRKDLFWLKYSDSTDPKSTDLDSTQKGTILHSDTNGDGIPDYLFSPNGQFKVSSIRYEKFDTNISPFDIQELPPVNPDRIYPASP